jgi:adenylate cyclase
MTVKAKKSGKKQDRHLKERPEQGGEGDLAQRMILSTIRHELRTPLNAIIGYSEMLLEDAEDLGQDVFIADLKNINAAGNEMLGIVNEILDPSHIETGRTDLDLKDLEARLTHALRTPLHAVVGYSEMLVESAKELDKEECITDLMKIRAASEQFLGLIKDIVRFSKFKSGPIDADLASSDTSAMVKGVVSTIRPLSQEDDPLGLTVRSDILVVDDNAMNRDLLARHIERQGHAITIAENGRHALETLKRRAFDLILLDVLMPEMNGYQVLQRLKADDTWRDIPVLMVSAVEEMDIVVRCIEMGADDYLAKPFNPVLLRARVTSCLERKRLRDIEKEQKRILKETFGKYVAHEVRDEVLAGRIPLDGELKDVTVLFADLRNFTPLTEYTPPKEMVKILNNYFTEMTPAIHRHRGSILRYVGDEIYTVFSAPLPLKDHPRHAVEAALDMRRLLGVVNMKLARQGYGPLSHGVGIHSGPVVAANIGSPDRLAYDLVGDTVNLASRIQELTKQFRTDILISATTRGRLKGDIPVEKLPAITVKGKREPVEVYRVI